MLTDAYTEKMVCADDVCVCCVCASLFEAYDRVDAFTKQYSSEDTRVGYRNKLRMLLKMFHESGLSVEPDKIGTDEVNKILDMDVLQSTKLIYYTILKRFCIDMSEAKSNHILGKLKLKFDIVRMNVKTIEYEDYLRLLKSLKRPAERIAIMIGGEFGLRRKEICNLKVEDINGKWLNVVRGKNGKTSRLPISDLMSIELMIYLDERKKLVEKYGYSGNELIIYRHRGVRPLTHSTLYVWIRTFTQRLGFDTSPHALRSMYITNKFDSGVPPQIVQKLARHNDINDTFKYYRSRDDLLFLAQNVAVDRANPIDNAVNMYRRFI